MKTEIYPGILTHTYEEYITKLELVEKSGVKWAHIDIMDGQFVPNISVMPHEIMSVSTTLSLEAHLMTYRPERYFSDLTVAGVSRVLLHREVYQSLEECAQAIKQAGDYFAEVGIVVNPDTPLEDYSTLDIKVIQCMGIHPGASGQPFLPSAYDTIKAVCATATVPVAVDGGVHEDNIQQLQKLGASRFVISSHLFITNSVANSLQHFIQLLGGA